MNRLDKKKLYKDIAIVAVALIISGRLIGGVVSPYSEAKEENDNLQASIEKANSRNEDLQKALNESENSTNIEKGYVRERFHLSNEDELIFVFPDDNE